MSEDAASPDESLPTLTQLQALRYDIYESLPTPEGNAYLASLGVDYRTIEAESGCVVFRRVRYFPDHSFDLLDIDDASGVLSAIVEVLDADARTIIDLCAWPLHRPDKFATALRRGDALGLWRVQDRGSYRYSEAAALRIFRTPEDWLRTHCWGAVILNPLTAPRWLASAPGNLLADDLDHGREIARILHPFFDPRRILAPLSVEAA